MRTCENDSSNVKVIMAFDYYEGLDNCSKLRYDQKLKLIGLNECPYKLPAGAWKNDPTKWPLIEYGDIHNYLVETPGKL